MAKVMEKSWNYSLVPRIFSNRGGQFKGNSSNLRQINSKFSPTMVHNLKAILAI